MQQARHADHDFVPSLRLLVERERYSLHDIGLMFDVTRECVRQWCSRYGIVHPDRQGSRGLMTVRVWNDAAHRFVPVQKRVIRRAQRTVQAQRRLKHLAAARVVKQQRIVEKVLALRSVLGRDPSIHEIAEAIAGHSLAYTASAGTIVGAWFGRSGEGDYREAITAIREASGCRARPRGRPGHISS